MALNLTEEIVFKINGSITYVDNIPQQTEEETYTILGEIQPSSQENYALSTGNVAVKKYNVFIGLSEDIDTLCKADSITFHGETWSILGYYKKTIGAHEIYVGTKTIKN